MSFQQTLMDKYPDLFYQREDGSLECPCDVWVPQGWEMIVDDLCGSITSYIKNTYRSEREIVSKKYYLWHNICKLLDWSHRRFLKLFPKYNKWEYNKPFYSFVEKFRQRSYKCVKYKKVHPPAVKIDQIKEKFGGLRFYYSGGDKKVDGMVHFAEYLAERTCEVSGETGELCIRGSWYKTLSNSVRSEQLYQGYIPVNKTVEV